MQPKRARDALPELSLRPAEPSDVAPLMALEQQVFTGDRISRRGFRRFIASPRAALIVAAANGALAGYVLVLFRDRSVIARLYSIAVAPEFSGRGAGVALLAAAEEAALERGCGVMRLEVHERNDRAIERYRKAGYKEFGRHSHYYADRGHALRFEKVLRPRIAFATPPRYFPQTTEFTCGPACVIMALSWADPAFKPEQAVEFALWREATTIFLSSGPGGCDPYGLAVAMRRRGLDPEVHVSRTGPYFLETVRTQDKRSVMRLTQQQFQREALQLGVRTHSAAPTESLLISAFDTGAVAIVLVSGYHMVRRRVPHWVFAFGHSGRFVLIHDPAAPRSDDRSRARPAVAEASAVPWRAFMQMTRFGRDRLSAAILVRKGPPQ
jgi:ribosomal protein S18 acetylase RimI-like enzyme